MNKTRTEANIFHLAQNSIDIAKKMNSSPKNWQKKKKKKIAERVKTHFSQLEWGFYLVLWYQKWKIICIFQ